MYIHHKKYEFTRMCYWGILQLQSSGFRTFGRSFSKYAQIVHNLHDIRARKRTAIRACTVWTSQHAAWLNDQGYESDTQSELDILTNFRCWVQWRDGDMSVVEEFDRDAEPQEQPEPGCCMHALVCENSIICVVHATAVPVSLSLSMCVCVCVCVCMFCFRVRTSVGCKEWGWLTIMFT